MLNDYVVMCMLSKINLKSADLVFFYYKHCLEIPLTGYVLYFFPVMTGYRLLCTIFTLYALSKFGMLKLTFDSALL